MTKRLFKERISKSFAVVLAFALILTNMNTIAFAAEPQGTESDKKIITKIGEPDSSVLLQTLAVGAEESDIQFPESLTATVTKEQETETPAEPETEKETVPETEQSSEEKTPEEVTEEPAETEEKSSETEQTESTEPEEKSSETEPTEASGTEEKLSETEQTNTTETEVNAPETESVQTTETEQKAIETESAEATETTETTETEKSVAEQLFGWLAPMTVYAAERNEKEESIAVTWKLDESASTSEAFDASKAGNTYVYIPVIPGEYTVAEGVELPKITVTIGTDKERSEVIKALQSRINALPTVDEFIAMADGTTVEDSTLNQAQLDVYNEAQAIAEEIDKLTDEEQGQLDTGKLEALFEYFNGMTAETALTPGSTVTLSKYTQYIETAGTYNIAASSGLTATGNVLYIRKTSASDEIILNIQGNISISDSYALIVVYSPCNLTIKGNGYTIKNTGSSNVIMSGSGVVTNININGGSYSNVGKNPVFAFSGSGTVNLNNITVSSSNSNVINNKSDSNILINGGTFTGNSNSPAFANAGGGTLTFRDVTINNGGLNNANSKSTVNIEEGTVFNCVSSFPYGIAGGIIRMTGGTINGDGNPGPIYSGTSYDDIEITGGSIIGGKYGINLTSNSSGNVRIGGSAVLNNNTADVYLYTGKTFTVNENYQGKIKVALSTYPDSNTKQQITKSQSTDYQKDLNVVSANSSYSVNYDTSGKYLYMWKHEHTWSYSASEDTITAKCTSDSDCKYYSEGLTATLTAPDMTYTGSAYDKASVENNISSVTGKTANIEYYKVDTENTTDGGTKLSSAPIDTGYYYAAVTMDGATAKAAFKITSVVLKESDVTLDSNSFERTDSEISPTVTVKVTIDGKEITLTAGTDYELSGDTSETDTGSYTLTVTGKGNYAGTINKKWEITKQKITVEPKIEGWTYGESANTPSVEDGSNPENGKVTYTYYTDENCTNKTTSADGAAADGAVPKNAGTYYVKAEVAETDNYAAGSGKKEFTIEKKEIGIEWSDDSLTYNGKSQTPTATATGLLDGDTCTITVTGGQKDTNAKTGNDKYTATADAVDNTNYKLPADGTTHEFTITPAELTVTWKDTELTYNGKEQAPTAELNGLMEGDTCGVTVTGGQTDANAKTNTESYPVTASIDDKNYELKDATGTFKILPKSIKGAAVKLTPGDVVHTGSEISQTVDTVTLDGVALTVSDDYEIAGSSTFKATDFGVYTITVNGVGNYKDSASVDWKIRDENPPTGEIVISENKWTSFWNGVTFGHFFKKTQTVTINASDEGSGVDKVYYYNSNVILSLDAVEALADSEWKAIKNGGSYNIDPENQYVVYAKITDKSGNVTYISSEGFVIDKTAPTITGVKDQGAYCEAVTFTATDAYLKTVTVDGTAVTLSADGSYTIQADDKAHTIVAEDKAGNTTTVHVTVYNGHSWKAPVFTWAADYSSAKATFTCAHDDSHTETKDCTVKKETTKQASGTQKGEITYTATVTFDGKTYEDTKTQETVVAGSEEIGSNGGKITTEIIVSDDMPKTEIKNLTVETAKALLTADELAQVEAGAEITIYLEANSLTEDAVSTSDKTYVEGKLDGIMEQLMQSEGLTSKKQVSTGIQYIDLSLYKRIGNGVATKLKSTGQNELEITVEIPANLKSDNSKRTYYIIRVHETDAGTEVDILPTTKSGDELTFKTDRFSTYAIAYAEPNSYVMPAKVTLNPTQATLTSKGATTQLTATIEPSNATNKNVTWASSDTSVATVDANGLVTAVANGTATITVTTEEGGLTATATITVKISSGGGDTPTPNPSEEKKPTSISLNKTKDTLTSKGSTSQLIATVKPDDAANKNVTWKSSDTSVATVDANGLVTAVANGTATITVTTVEGGLTATATITVKISSGDNGNNDSNDNNNNNNSSDNNNGNNSNNDSSAVVPDSQKNSQSVTSPKTGDDFNMALWTTLLIASVAGLAALFGRRKKRS